MAADPNDIIGGECHYCRHRVDSSCRRFPQVAVGQPYLVGNVMNYDWRFPPALLRCGEFTEKEKP
jgi:hypothetical protein